MRALYLAPFAFAVGLVVSHVQAAEMPRDIKGLYLMTDYPAVTVRPGTTSNIPLRLQNYGLDPQRYQLSVTGVPSGWTATLLGGGQPSRRRCRRRTPVSRFSFVSTCRPTRR
jgi:hypothetical protein